MVYDFVKGPVPLWTSMPFWVQNPQFWSDFETVFFPCDRSDLAHHARCSKMLFLKFEKKAGLGKHSYLKYALIVDSSRHLYQDLLIFGNLPYVNILLPVLKKLHPLLMIAPINRKRQTKMQSDPAFYKRFSSTLNFFFHIIERLVKAMMIWLWCQHFEIVLGKNQMVRGKKI